MYTIRPIRSEEDYEAACARIRELMGAQLNTPEGDELDVLADLVEHYEDKRYPIGMPTAIDAIEFRMDQAGLTRRDLIPLIGSRQKVSDILTGKRDIKPKYLVNEKGRKTAAVLSMKEYRALMQRLQDLEDALELDEAVDTATGFRAYAEIRTELQNV